MMVGRTVSIEVRGWLSKRKTSKFFVYGEQEGF